MAARGLAGSAAGLMVKQRQMRIQKNLNLKTILLLLMVAVMFVALRVIWKTKNVAGVTVDSRVSLQGGEAPTQLRLMQKLTQLLRQHPHADHFRLYWNDSELCSLEYRKNSQSLASVVGDTRNQCWRYIYKGVSPEHIRRVVEKRGTARTLREFGCKETAQSIGGSCE